MGCASSAALALATMPIANNRVRKRSGSKMNSFMADQAFGVAVGWMSTPGILSYGFWDPGRAECPKWSEPSAGHSPAWNLHSLTQVLGRLARSRRLAQAWPESAWGMPKFHKTWG